MLLSNLQIRLEIFCLAKISFLLVTAEQVKTDFNLYFIIRLIKFMKLLVFNLYKNI